MEVKPVVLDGRVVRLEPLAERRAEDLARAASPELFAYHFPPSELSPEGFREQIRGLRALPGGCPFVRDTVMHSVTDTEGPQMREGLERRMASS